MTYRTTRKGLKNRRGEDTPSIRNHADPCFCPAPGLLHFDEQIVTFRYYAGRRMFRQPRAAPPGIRICGHTPPREIFNDVLSNEKKESVVSEVLEYKSWVCLICGWIYNEEDGLPEDGIAAGTRFADIPDTWRCPLCDVGKDDFVAVEF
ncbi:Anaerobic nitric oxide reductase flavorubredoxin [Caballeronia sp. SBC1]|nr:Anaerobic nitric oxide reductase flavorubredoxin [Caballeronia sp. SBC2]QIN61049.1 Anaerobic nitric oxide reductase flavorubredoxin [Caballeronia sp. SBC1]